MMTIEHDTLSFLELMLLGSSSECATFLLIFGEKTSGLLIYLSKQCYNLQNVIILSIVQTYFKQIGLLFLEKV